MLTTAEGIVLPSSQKGQNWHTSPGDDPLTLQSCEINI